MDLEYTKMKKIEKAIPKAAKGFSTSLYTYMLEAWRRGINVKLFNIYYKEKRGIRLLLTHNDKSHRFQFSLGDKVKRDVTKVTKLKHATKEILSNKGVPVPKGNAFTKTDSIDDIINYSKDIDYPLVAKPTDASVGRGVCVNINTEEELREALVYIRSGLGYDNILVEQMVSGYDTRMMIVDGQVISVFRRIPISVFGNGEDTIKQLIINKNKIRKKHPHVSKQLIVMDEELNSFIGDKGYSLESVPLKDQRIYLSDSTLATTATEIEDMTDVVSEKAKNVAVRAAHAMNISEHCGIDVMVDQEKDTAYVLEINSRPNLGGCMFPTYGKGRDIPKSVIDLYFPETKDIDITNKLDVFINYNRIVEMLNKGIVDEVTLAEVGNENISKLVTITGQIKHKSFKKWIRNRAVNYNLFGEIDVKEDVAKIKVFGGEENVQKFLEKLDSHEFKNTVIETKEVCNYKGKIYSGFRIK